MELARKIRAELVGRFGDVQASASRPTATHSLRMAFHEARCALEAVRLRNGSAPEVATYEDLGAFQLLLSLQDDEALGSYCRSVLDPIEQGEGEYGDELVRSLDVFIEHNGHWEKAANALFCHRHTLRYRIRRIEQLTGRDFSSARDRIEFWLALRGGSWRDERCAFLGPPPGVARGVAHTRRETMRIGVPTEVKTDEYRVAITPAGVQGADRARARGAGAGAARARAAR